MTAERTGMDEAVEKAGSYVKLAEALEVSHQIVHKWCKRGYAPPRRAEQISRLYGIPAHRLMDPEVASIARAGG